MHRISESSTPELHRFKKTLWKVAALYGIPSSYVNMLKASFEDAKNFLEKNNQILRKIKSLR